MRYDTIAMFARIAKHYDIMNTVMTAGLHRRWRRKAVRLSGASPSKSVLDCATGTGDFALEFLRAVGPTGRVVAIDICEPMLDAFRHKLKELPSNLTIEIVDVQELPYDDASFDIVSMGWGIRNVEDPHRALNQMVRVTKPGGTVVIIETGVPSGKISKQVYRLYANKLIPFLGLLIARDKEAYDYLPRTASTFPYGEAFCAIMETTGMLNHCTAIPLLGGVSYLYIGIKST